MRRRFGIFLFGVLLGVMIVRFAFPGRFTEYTQYFSLDYRVLYHLKSDTIYISPKAQCHLECLNLEQTQVLDVLDGGNVNFDKSDKHANPCKYYVVEKERIVAGFELCDDIVKLKDFSFGVDSCTCD